MNRIQKSIVVFFLAVSAALAGETAQVDIMLVSSSNSEVRAQFDLPPIETLMEAGEDGRLSLMWTSDERPIPAVTRWVAVPSGNRAEVHVQNRQSHLLGPNDGIGDGSNLLDRMTLDNLQLEPEIPAEVGEPVYFRGVKIVPLTVYPIQFDRSAQDAAVVNTQIDVSVRFVPDATEQSIERPHDAPGSDAARFLDQLLLNPPSRDPGGQFSHIGRILIVHMENLPALGMQYLDSLANWKRQLGYRVDFLPANPQGDLIQLRSLIRQNYYSGAEDPISYLLFVGSETQSAVWFPFFPGVVAGDHYWGVMQDSNRFVNDVAVGRLYATSLAELQGVIKRTILYEREPFLDDQNQRAWFRRAIFTAENIAVEGGQFVPSMLHLGRWIWGRLIDMGFNTDTLYASDSVSAASVDLILRQRLPQGVNLLLSRGWLTGCFDNFLEDRAVNTGRRHPFAAAITCLSYDTQRKFFRLTNVNRPSGPIANIGIAGLTNTKYNNSMLGGMVRGLRDFGIYQPGYLQITGKMQVRGDYRPAPALDEQALALIVASTLMGDPSVKLFLSSPVDLQVEHPASVTPNTTGLTVRVRIADGAVPQNAVVTVYQRGGVHYVNYPDINGYARFTFDAGELEEGRLSITVTGRNLAPYVGGLTVEESNSMIDLQQVAFDNNDGLFGNGERIPVTLTLRNSGGEAVQNIQVHLSSDYPAFSFSSDNINVGNIATGATGTARFDLIIGRNSRSDWNARIGVRVVSGQSEWNHAFGVVTSAPEPGITVVNLANGDIFDRGRIVRMQPVLSNNGDLVLPAVNARLISLNEDWVVVTEGNARYPQITAGNNALPDAYFRVALSNFAIPGRSARFMMILSAQNGEDAYSDTVYFSRQIGQPGVQHPFGPDEYGYLCFDSGDSTWDKRPNYVWREINYNLEGAEFRGTRLPLADNGNNLDTSGVVELPFTFVYYGREFNDIVICSNGWAALGGENSKFVDFRNYPIPGVQGPDAQLAVYWDDLINEGASEVDGIYYHYVSDEGIFIIEWSGLEVYTDHNPQEFQIILYDPARWPTQSGNGEIKFQYKTINVVPGEHTDNYYATVGIKNLDNTGGLQYSYWNQYSPNCRPLENGMALLFTTEIEAATGNLSGRVVLAEDTNSVVSGVTVRTSVGHSMITGVNGQFQFENMPVGNHRLTVSKPNYSDQSINFSIERGQDLQLTVYLTHPVINVPERVVSTRLQAGDEGDYQYLTVSNEGNGPLNFRVRRRYTDGSVPQYPLQLYTPVSREVEDGLLWGCEMIGDRLYVAGSVSFNDAENYVYLLDRNGSEVRRFLQNTQSTSGFRDLAWDGRTLYGGDIRLVGNSNVTYIVGLDTTGNVVGEWPLAGSIFSEAWALAWNPERSSLYVGQENRDIAEYQLENDTLRIVHQFHIVIPGVNELNIKGMAWNATDEDGMKLYILSQHDLNQRYSTLLKVNPATGQARIVRQLAESSTERGTGLAIGFEREIGKAMLAYIADNRLNDSLRVFEIGSDSRFVDYDLAWQTVPAGNSYNFPILFKSRYLLNNRTYETGLLIEHNSAEEPVLVVARLEVTPDAGIGNDHDRLIPQKIFLSEAYPNPFNSRTTLSFGLPINDYIRLSVYDIQGRLVSDLFTGKKSAGRYSITFDASQLGAGVYLYRLETANSTITRRMVLMK